MGSNGSDSEARALHLANYICVAVILFNWTMVITAGIGCVIVMVMKGPGYVADSYRVSHSEAPRAEIESDEEADQYRSGSWASKQK